MQNKIPVVFSTNDNYVHLCSVAISSVIENASNKNIYEIYVFYTRLSETNILNLENMSKENINIKCINIHEYLEYDILYETSEYPIEMYYRYYAPLILKYEKIIYLDCDIVVIDDIAKLYNESLENKPIGIITDFTHYIDEPNTDYNSGVILFNTEEFEKQKIREKCLELLKNNTQYRFPDQTALNIVCKNNAKILKPMYNYQVSMAFFNKFKKKIKKKRFRKLFEDEPIVIHFSYVTKPYKNIYSIYNKYFWEYAKKTNYYNQLVDEYVKDPYEVLKNSPIEDIYIDMTREGNVGLRKIFYVLSYQLKYWLLFKINGGKSNE